MVYWFVLHLTLMQRTLTPRLRTFADLNLCVVNMREHLAEIAHIEPFPAARTFHEMIGLSFGDAVRIEAVILGGLVTPC